MQWDEFPLELVAEFEKLTLMTYTYNNETRQFASKLNTLEIQKLVDFIPR